VVAARSGRSALPEGVPSRSRITPEVVIKINKSCVHQRHRQDSRCRTPNGRCTGSRPSRPSKPNWLLLVPCTRPPISASRHLEQPRMPATRFWPPSARYTARTPRHVPTAAGGEVTRVQGCVNRPPAGASGQAEPPASSASVLPQPWSDGSRRSRRARWRTYLIPPPGTPPNACFRSMPRSPAGPSPGGSGGTVTRVR